MNLKRLFASIAAVVVITHLRKRRKSRKAN